MGMLISLWSLHYASQTIPLFPSLPQVSVCVCVCVCVCVRVCVSAVCWCVHTYVHMSVMSWSILSVSLYSTSSSKCRIVV